MHKLIAIAAMLPISPTQMPNVAPATIMNGDSGTPMAGNTAIARKNGAGAASLIHRTSASRSQIETVTYPRPTTSTAIPARLAHTATPRRAAGSCMIEPTTVDHHRPHHRPGNHAGPRGPPGLDDAGDRHPVSDEHSRHGAHVSCAP